MLAERHLDGAFDLTDGVEVLVDGAWQPVQVTGTASSGEYLWLASSKQELVSLPSEFGVLFAPEPVAEELTGRAPNQVLVRLADGVARDELAPRIEQVARELGATGVTTWDDQPSNAALQEDITGFSQMALLFPLLFLTAAAMASYTLLSRQVHRERPLIGMLRAQGASRRDVARHESSSGWSPDWAARSPGCCWGCGWLGRSPSCTSASSSCRSRPWRSTRSRRSSASPSAP